MYFVKTPKIIQKLFSRFTWKIKTKKKVIFLTFDDGPIPEVTPFVLNILAQYNAKATFFCVGDNVRKHPDVFKQVVDAGHSVGNHTYNHFNGWSSSDRPYCQNVQRCADLVESNIFRPPYGRIKRSQAQMLQEDYQIIMWDVLSGDFDARISVSDCVRNVTHNAQQGSVVVFHDSLKAWDKLQHVLPEVLEHYSKLGYSFSRITDEMLQMPRRAMSA